MALMMFDSKKDVEAVNFAKSDMKKYEGVEADYAYHGNFDGSQIRF